MKPSTKSFLLGTLFGAVLTLVVIGARSCTGLGETTVYYDNQARAAIARCGFTLPDAITDPYYGITGFQDRILFIAFSGPRDVLDNIVETKTGKEISELACWETMNDHEAYMLNPSKMGEHYRTMFYDPARVIRGRCFRDEKGEVTWHLIYDRDGGRVYYCWQNR